MPFDWTEDDLDLEFEMGCDDSVKPLLAATHDGHVGIYRELIDGRTDRDD